ncbi:MAG: amidohydrolase family protein [Actinomycetes bacterium]|nr:hypothetical protein [Acidimicrobiia bacterium]
MLGVTRETGTLARRCSFCGEDRRKVDRLVEGQGGVAICGDCARLAAELTSEPESSSGDLLVTGIGTLVTNDTRYGGLLGEIPGAAVAVRNGRVTWVGRERALPDRYRELPEIDCGGRMVVPGFVDAHRHFPAVAGTDLAAYTEAAADQLGRLLEQGATTVEMRSFGAPDPETEVTVLSAVAAAGDMLPCDVVTSVVVGTDPPPRGRGYQTMLESLLLPTVARVASYLDVVVGGPLDRDAAKSVITAGRRHGLRPRVHIFGGEALELAVEGGAVSVDGLWGVDGSAAPLAETGIVAVSVPAASWMDGRKEPASELWEAGAIVALGSACSGGSVPTIPMAMAIAVHHGGMAPDAALWAATRGGALALEEPEKGMLGLGATADLVVLEAETPADIVAEPGRDPVWRVIKDGSPL